MGPGVSGVTRALDTAAWHGAQQGPPESYSRARPRVADGQRAASSAGVTPASCRAWAPLALLRLLQQHVFFLLPKEFLASSTQC